MEKDGSYIKLTGTDKLELESASGSFTFRNYYDSSTFTDRCCVISADLSHDVSENNTYTAKLYRDNALMMEKQFVFPKAIDFIYPKTPKELEAITLDTDSIDVVWHPENEKNLAAVVGELKGHGDKKCSEIPKLSWRNPDFKESEIGPYNSVLKIDNNALLLSKVKHQHRTFTSM